MSDAMENTRIAYLDVAKFIGIACVVIGHVGSPVDHNAVIAAVHDFVYQFHLPLFFFLSGVFYRKRDTFSQFLKDKLKGLYVPYLISNTILLIVYCIVRSLFGQEFILIDNVKHLVKVSLGLTWTSLAGATWFLLTLLESLVFYDLFERICSRSNSKYLKCQPIPGMSFPDSGIICKFV